MTKVGISILSSNYMKLGSELKTIEQSEADFLHIDIMDGHFVPNITFGSDMVKQISKASNLPLDVHLMIANPEKYIQKFAEVGADLITVHYEAAPEETKKYIDLIHSYGVKAGVAINPETPAESIKDLIGFVDLILQMTVTPGFGGQNFNANTLENIEKITQWRKEEDLSYFIEVDGGINQETAKVAAQSGVDTFVLGSAFFKAEDKLQLVHKIQSI